MLRAEGVVAYRGVIRALNRVTVEVAAGERVAVLGPNGAGKSTLLRVMSGLTHAVEGSVDVDGRDITATPAHRIARMGIAVVPEGRGLFPELTTDQNLVLGGYSRGAFSGAARARADVDRLYAQFEILRRVRRQDANSLSGGEAQLVAIARALVSRPRYLLLDEPSTGLAPAVIDQVGDFISGIAEEEVGILLVEQNLGLALSVASRFYLLSGGEVVFAGDRAEFLKGADVFSAYLGRYGTELATAAARAESAP